MPVLLDVESRSRADLKRVGGRKYWQHPSSEVLCVVAFDTRDGALSLWRPGDAPPAFARDVLAAHNMTGFDRFALARAWGRPIDAPFVDTSELARKAGLPGALDALGTRWLGLPKDKAASKFTRSLSSVRRPARGDARISPEAWRALSKQEKRERGVLPALTPEKLARVYAYCLSDVEIITHGWPLLESWLAVDAEANRVDRLVNDRGFGFDAELARALLRCDADNAVRVVAETARVCGMTPTRVREIAGSPLQFAAYTCLFDAQKATLDDALEGSWLGANARAMCLARRALASIARGKLEAGLDRVEDDGRIRDAMRYQGAHTGRWSHRGFQPGNLPRPAKRYETWGDDEICRAADAVLAGGDAEPELVDVLLRACIVPRAGHALVTCDFSGVEGRGTAWCADDRVSLDVIARNLDPYRFAAAAIFGVSYDDIPKSDVRRNAGKMAELACGYGGGVNALLKIARSNGVNLATTGADPQQIVDGWRGSHPDTVRFWHDAERAFGAAVRGEVAAVDCFEFVPSDDGTAVAAILPSGRLIVYNDARFVRGHGGRLGLAYTGTKGVEHIYGGKIVENLIQAMCRDLLADALVAVENAGLAPVLHVHDEIVCEVPACAAQEAYAFLRETMLALPDWARGFPVGAAGHVGRRYRK